MGVRRNDSTIPEDGETLWGSAQTFAEMYELTARYIEDTCDFFPGYGGSTDSETNGISSCPIAYTDRSL